MGRSRLGPAGIGVVSGISFGAFSFLVGLGSAFEILIGSIAFALLMAIVAHRKARGEVIISTPLAIGFSVAALALYTWTFLIRDQPEGIGWLPVVGVFAFPLLLLVLVLRGGSHERPA